MVAIDDIEDEHSFKAWLEETGQSREACVWLAHRAAMRVLPVHWHWIATSNWAQEREAKAMSALRASLISGVAAFVPTSDVMSAAHAAYNASFYKGSRSSHISSPVDAANAASFSSLAAADVHYTAYASNAAYASDAADAALRQDCQTLVDTNGQVPRLGPAVWDNAEHPFAQDWQAVRARLDPQHWSFWIDWYTRALEGTEDRWPLLERIALSNLDPRADGKTRDPGEFHAFWKGTDAEVNARISLVVSNWNSAQFRHEDIVPPKPNPNAEPNEDPVEPPDATTGPKPVDLVASVRARTRSEIKSALLESHQDIHSLSQYVVDQLQREVALHQTIACPNEDPGRSEHNARGNFLNETLVAVTALCEALPEKAEEPISDEKAETFKDRLIKLASVCQEALSYLDQNTGTPGNLWKLGVITACSQLMAVCGIPIVAGLTAASGVVGVNTIRVIWSKR